MTADSCHSPRDERPTRPVAATAEEHRPAPASAGIRRTEDRAQHSGHRKGPVPRSRFSITICCKTRMHQPGLPWRAGSRPSQCSRPQRARPWHGSHGEPYSFAYVRVTAAGARRRCGTAPRSRVHLLREGRLADRRQAATRPAPVGQSVLATACGISPTRGFPIRSDPPRSGHLSRQYKTRPTNPGASTSAQCSCAACTSCSSSSTATGECTWPAPPLIQPRAWVTQQARNHNATLPPRGQTLR